MWLRAFLTKICVTGLERLQFVDSEVEDSETFSTSIVGSTGAPCTRPDSCRVISVLNFELSRSLFETGGGSKTKGETKTSEAEN
jgi:hypothetical protein